MYEVAANGHIEMASLLYSAKADMNQADITQEIALHRCCEYGQVEMATFLIHALANINAKTRNNDTPLSLSVRGGHSYLASKLRDYGAIETDESSVALTS